MITLKMLCGIFILTISTADNFCFQEEDGIRDADVTGVRTCALPISPEAPSPWDEAKRKVSALVLEELADRIQDLHGEARERELRDALDRILQREDIQVTPLERQIGRASWRERADSTTAPVDLKLKRM